MQLDSETTSNLFDLNEQYIEDIQSAISPHKLNEYLDTIEWMSLIDQPELDRQDKFHLKNIAQVLLFKHYRHQLFNTGNLIHGTHVAGVTVRGLENSNLFVFPWISKSEISTFAQIRDSDIDQEIEELKIFCDHVSRIIGEQEIRVINMSMGTSEKDALRMTREFTRIISRFYFREKIHEEIQQGVSEVIGCYKQIIDENPQTIFVKAAGNDGVNLDDERKHSSLIRAKNLLIVGATDKIGNRAEFSNYSSNYVHVAAYGTAVESSLLGGGSIRLSGTSMAAPFVSNQIAKIIEQDPSLDVEQTLEIFFKEHVVKLKDLFPFFENGNLLIQSDSPNSSAGTPK